MTKISGVQAPTTSTGVIDYSYKPGKNQLRAQKASIYDNNGNMTADGANTFTYDALNRVTKVEQQIAAPSPLREIPRYPREESAVCAKVGVDQSSPKDYRSSRVCHRRNT